MLFIVIIIFLGVVLVDFLVRGLRNPLSHVPGPWYSRYTTVVLTYVTITGRRTHYVHGLHEKYGTYVMFLYKRPKLILLQRQGCTRQSP
jgi:hypothetical protein